MDLTEVSVTVTNITALWWIKDACPFSLPVIKIDSSLSSLELNLQDEHLHFWNTAGKHAATKGSTTRTPDGRHSKKSIGQKTCLVIKKTYY
jgi:hypothetical protein